MKTLVMVVILVTLLVISPALAYPTYTSNTHVYSGGTYGATDIPIWFDDETGKQMFDGDYGGYDWFAHPGGVLSVEDYWARYDQENGYGYGWVAWYGDVPTPTVIFKMDEPFAFQQLGVHGYQRASGSVFLPESITVSFSENGIDFSNYLTQSFNISNNPDDGVCWENFVFQPTIARYIQVQFSPPSTRYWLDEISINGMDGTSFIPEPSSLFALLAGIVGIGILKRR